MSPSNTIDTNKYCAIFMYDHFNIAIPNLSRLRWFIVSLQYEEWLHQSYNITREARTNWPKWNVQIFQRYVVWVWHDVPYKNEYVSCYSLLLNKVYLLGRPSHLLCIRIDVYVWWVEHLAFLENSIFILLALNWGCPDSTGLSIHEPCIWIVAASTLKCA